jgi:hypothetical protein
MRIPKRVLSEKGDSMKIPKTVLNKINNRKMNLCNRKEIKVL